MEKFKKSFTQQDPIAPAGVKAAIEVMQSGRLHRYNRLNDELTETDLFELEFAKYMGIKNVLSCASGGYALTVAMRAVGVKEGDIVLCNGFTLSPVPGSIHSCGAKTVLVEMDESYCIDLVDLEIKAKQTKARYLLLSHMRGHIVDMDKLMQIAKDNNLIVIEDCAHTMGAEWNGKKSGTFGDVACFSTQTYKHINSGEGGILITPHDEVMAKAIIYSGSYMFYQEHKAAPALSAFDGLYEIIPNCSGRMDNLRAAILRPQLAEMDIRRENWNARYRIIENHLRSKESIVDIPNREGKELFVGSSIQFRVPNFTKSQINQLVDKCAEYGVGLKWFGETKPKGYTSQYTDWQYLGETQSLPKTLHILSTFLDMRIPLTFSLEDCEQIGNIIATILQEVNDGRA